MFNEEKILILQTQNNYFRAFEKLVSLYEDMVYNLAYRMMGNVEDAEDVLQETFINVYRAINKFRQESKFSTWMYRIAYNICLSKLKVRPNNNVDIQDNLLGRTQINSLQDWSTLPDNIIISKELYSTIEKAVAALPPQNRAILILRDIEGYTTQEVSDITALSPAAVKSRLHRSRLMMRQALSDYFRATRVVSNDPQLPAAAPKKSTQGIPFSQLLYAGKGC